MTSLRSAILALALPVILLAPEHAVAADVFGSGGLVTLLPTATITSARPAVLRLIALGADGTPRTGLKLSLKASLGELGSIEELGGGVYTVPFTPPAVPGAVEQLTVEIEIFEAGAPGAAALSRSFVVVSPAPTVGLTTPTRPLVLGRDEGTSLSLEGASAVLAHTSNGALAAPVVSEDGTITVDYTAPGINIPQRAIVTLVDAADPFGTFAHGIVPLHGSVQYPLRAEEGSSVTVKVGSVVFGPVVAGSDGKASLTIDVPPGITTAEQVDELNGARRSTLLDLRIPESNRLALFPLPRRVLADGRIVPLRAVLLPPDGEAPPEPEVPSFSASVGTLGEPEALSGGVWQVDWTLPTTPGPATVSVLLGEGELHADQLELELTAARPSRVALTLDPETLALDPETLALEARVTGSRLAPGLFVDGGTLSAPLVSPGPVGVDVGAGEAGVEAGEAGVEAGEAGVGAGEGALLAEPTERLWTGTIERSGTELEIQAYVSGGGEPGGLYTIALLPERTSAPAGADVDVLVVALDAQGLAVPGIEIALSSEQGALFPPRTRTGDDGMARIIFRAGDEAGLATIRAASGRASGAGALVVGPEQITPRTGTFSLPPSGDLAAVAVLAGWHATTPSLWLPGDGPSPVGPLLELSVDPPTVVPGSTARVRALLLDDSGEIVAAPAVRVDASIGVLGAASVAEDGSVELLWQIPSFASGPFELEATTDTLYAQLEVPVAEAVAEVSPPEEGDFRWLRGRVSGVGSSYRYQQIPSSDPGPLLPATFSVGGPDGGTPASPLGGEVDLRAWGDRAGLPYLGVHGQFRFTSYGIEAPALQGEVGDALYNASLELLGRYPFDLAGDRYWVGGKVGFQYNDFLLFQGCLDPGCEVTFDPLSAPGLGLGAELGAELAELFLVAGYTGGIVRGSQPYANAVDVNVGYGFLENIYADLGFSVLSRTVRLVGIDSGLERGSLTDSQMMFKLGVGVAL